LQNFLPKVILDGRLGEQTVYSSNVYVSLFHNGVTMSPGNVALELTLSNSESHLPLSSEIAVCPSTIYKQISDPSSSTGLKTYRAALQNHKTPSNSELLKDSTVFSSQKQSSTGLLKAS